MATESRCNTTHDWTAGVDLAHLATIQQRAALFAPTGATHLVLEVRAYAADEAACGHGGRCRVLVFADGSISVSDDGRGTDTRRDPDGRLVKKPVLCSKDLRFFDSPQAQSLPDGHARRGMSVVAALSEWLVHVNRRDNGSWSQRYEQGIPVTHLVPIADDGTTGTTVHFQPDRRLLDPRLDIGAIGRSARAWDGLDVETRDVRAEASKVFHL